ncbi:hypothetical protein [Flavihumibacter solisilvae]|uniref:Uncharacterized protein n=1 Tax=Flavihumibacter solisilvae TaxID=1349421 RepID=A0A0C1ISD5_9BACT|nr:hypothetical protein [Flavihumibacter solisilvae]KIC93364.1 hypothetical protein OI18_16380 [Flavihumibacter solisilvae]
MVRFKRYNPHWLLALLSIFFQHTVTGQDTLPDFSAVIRTGNKVLISWSNPYGSRIRQLSIQRSADSVRAFKTIMTIPDPTVLQNGFLDAKVRDTNQYYRLYILLDSGKYVFSKSEKAKKFIPPPPPPKPAVQSVVKKPDERANSRFPPRPVDDPPVENNVVKDKAVRPAVKLPVVVPEKIYTLRKGDLVIGTVAESAFRRFRDSINFKTKDTLQVLPNDTLLVKAFVPKEVYRPSKYVFMDKAGLLHIALPEAGRRNYRVKFYEEDKSLLFEIKDIRDQVLLLDKANFQHAGWFLFELFEDGLLKEKNRFFIARDF